MAKKNTIETDTCHVHAFEIKAINERIERLDSHKGRILKELEETSIVLTSIQADIKSLKTAFNGSEININDEGMVGDIKDLRLKVTKLEEKTVLFGIIEKLSWIVIGVLVKYIIDGKIPLITNKDREIYKYETTE